MSAEQDQAAALQSLQGQPLPLPPAGNFGALNSSGVNSASANQTNDPSLDGFQSFQGAPVTFVKADQAETSMAAAGNNIVVGYNSSAGIVFSDAAGDISKLLLDGFSVSHDAGKTWKSGFIPAEPGAPPFDFGDPAYLREGVDRFAALGRARIPSPWLTMNAFVARWSFGTVALLYRLRARVDVRAIYLRERQAAGW